MSRICLYKGIKRVHPDWLKLQNEMTTRMSNNSIDMSFLLKFYAYIDSGYPVWEDEEKREIVLKQQEKTKQWQDYCKKLEEKIKLLEDTTKNQEAEQPSRGDGGIEKEVDMISLKNNRSTKCKSCATKDRRNNENIK